MDHSTSINMAIVLVFHSSEIWSEKNSDQFSSRWLDNHKVGIK